MTLIRGTITTEHTVWCARARRDGVEGMPFDVPSTSEWPEGCESHYQASSTAAEIARDAREMGWLQTREFGWLCTPCAIAYRAWKTKAA